MCESYKSIKELCNDSTGITAYFYQGMVSLAHLNWAQILISLGLGFLLGWIVFRRKW